MNLMEGNRSHIINKSISTKISLDKIRNDLRDLHGECLASLPIIDCYSLSLFKEIDLVENFTNVSTNSTLRYIRRPAYQFVGIFLKVLAF